MAEKKEKVRNITIDPHATLLSALQTMDRYFVKLLIVCEGQKFFSVLSIGDIQRAIIKNFSLDAPITSALRTNVKVARIGDSNDEIKQKMLADRIECMPVIGEDNQLEEVIFWEDLFQDGFRNTDKLLEIPVVIMAGGQGSRLKPITNIIPKPLIPIGEKPIIELIIGKFHAIGVKDFYLSVNYKHEMIKFYFDGIDKDYSLNYFLEKNPLGTAGSLHLLRDKIDTTFFVSNCDIIVDQDYQEIYDYHLAHQNELTIVAAIKHMKIPYGTLESGNNGELLNLKEKPELTFMINTGMYILEPHLLNEVPEDTFFHITDLIEIVRKRKGRVGVFPVSEGSWMDIGEWKEYNKTVKKLGYDEIQIS